MNHSDLAHNPVSNVQWVPIEKIYANNYNPNSVALSELKLLYISIREDGYTMPIVTYYHQDTDRYEIVDGFHRFTIMKRFKDIHDRNQGHLPLVVIKKPLAERMASTIRHNRARGKHNINGMGNMVIQLLGEGWADDRICFELGMEQEELDRLKHVTGYAKFFADAEYSRAAVSRRQIEARLTYARSKEKGKSDG